MENVPKPTGVSISEMNCRQYSHALADVLCWFAGFRAGNSEADMPPGINALRELNIHLKRGFWE